MEGVAEKSWGLKQSGVPGYQSYQTAPAAFWTGHSRQACPHLSADCQFGPFSDGTCMRASSKYGIYELER